jgi:muramoyltetrapeptide carboxypeptidase
MVYPPLLCRGDKVAIVAMSGPCDPVRLNNGVKVLESLGLSCVVTESCYQRLGFLSAPDDLRLRNLHESFASPEIRGIFAARGGYGAQRLLPYIDYGLIKKNPKVFAGYSDVTALHIILNQKCDLVTFHAPMPISDFGSVEGVTSTLQSLNDVLFKGIINFPKNNITLVPGSVSAPLVGGNLSVIVSSLGTPYEIDTHNRILFLEDINEEPYKIDRMLLQLKYAEKLKDAAGFILGDFSPQTLETLRQPVYDLLVPLGKPTVAGFPCGHTSPNITLPLGMVYILGK